MLLLVIELVVAYYVLRYLWELIPLPDLSKRAVFITGADTGFGHLLALKCAEKGLPTFAGCVTSEVGIFIRQNRRFGTARTRHE